MSIVAWIALGLVGGAVIGWLGGARRRDLLASVVVGALGAVIGGFMAASCSVWTSSPSTARAWSWPPSARWC